MIEPNCICTESVHLAGKLQFSHVPTAQEEWPYKWTKDPITYSVIRGTEDIPGEKIERLMANLAMTTWDCEIKTTLKWVPYDKEPDITIEWRRKEDDELFTSQQGVLAYAYFPKTSREGEVVFNDGFIWGPKEAIVNKTNPDGSISRVKQYNAIQTLIHELGHSLGLLHDQEHTDSVMFPFYNGQLNLIQSDIDRIVAKYGEQTWIGKRKGDFKKWLALRKIRF